MDVSINEVRGLMESAMQARHIGASDAEFIADDYIDAQLEGRYTHGIGKFLLIDHALEARKGNPHITYEAGAAAHIDGNKEIGQLAAKKACEIAADLAESNGIGLVSLTNTSRYSRLSPYVREIARRGKVGIAANNAGPAAVAPFGAIEPLFGTNPIAFGFPAADQTEPLVIDFSTAVRVWGEIRQAMLEGRPLPAHAFLDESGRETTVPEQVNAVLPFGGAKGSALCLAIELFAGVIAGSRVGLQVEDEYDLGAIFIAISPSPRANNDNGSPSGVTELLLADVRRLQPADGYEEVSAPGDRSLAKRLASIAAGTLQTDDETMSILRRMATGESGLTADKLTN